MSYLKLIPKAGKDTNKLTNWRPITLSNCDHKLITKTYAKRLSEAIAPKLNEGQTAYLKGRLINDNIRSMLATVEIANDENRKGLIVALDAKKAFDSVSHDYIESCLKEFGCSRFIPIFRTLYTELATDILINGRVVKGYNICRGVKQGDALSCILFIICMEPLLRNIDNNPAIAAMRSTLIGNDLPKTYAYADDVSATIRDDNASIRCLFNEYERLTKMSGLELNADKTEIMRLGRNLQEQTYNVVYLGRNYQVDSAESIKLNGIIFHRDSKEVIKRNVKAAIGRMDENFKKWSRRNLSTLGKILIAKTFGISQIVYLMQTIKMNETEFKLFNATLYKFIWNKHYLAAKAPERVKREIVNKSIKLGGFGMLDVAELDASIKLRALGRFLQTKHPFLSMIKNKLNLSNFFEPKLGIGFEGVLARGTELLRLDRANIWGNIELNRDRNIMTIIRNMKIKEVLNVQGQNSLILFMMGRQAGRVKDLTRDQLTQLERFIDRDKLDKIRLARSLNITTRVEEGTSESYLIRNKGKSLLKCTSKEIRIERSNKLPITNFKLGINLSTIEAINWGSKVNKLTSTKHKLSLLRAVHGEIYTKVKLKKYGLVNDDKCPRCDGIETLEHKIYSCEYTKRIWSKVALLTNESLNPDPLLIVTGATLDQTPVNLTIKAEILTRILSLPWDPSYLVLPKHFVKLAIENLIKKENKTEIKDALIDVMSTMVT